MGRNIRFTKDKEKLVEKIREIDPSLPQGRVKFPYLIDLFLKNSGETHDLGLALYEKMIYAFLNHSRSDLITIENISLAAYYEKIKPVPLEGSIFFDFFLEDLTQRLSKIGFRNIVSLQGYIRANSNSDYPFIFSNARIKERFVLFDMSCVIPAAKHEVIRSKIIEFGLIELDLIVKHWANGRRVVFENFEFNRRFEVLTEYLFQNNY